MQHRFSALSQYLIYSPMHSTQSHVSPLYTISFLPTLHNLLAYYAHNLIRHHALHAMAFLSTITKSHVFLRHTISMSPLPTISFLPTLPHLSPLRTISFVSTPHNLIYPHSAQSPFSLLHTIFLSLLLPISSQWKILFFLLQGHWVSIVKQETLLHSHCPLAHSTQLPSVSQKYEL